ncbi:hypothetical protein [Halovenus marina]|uniref:hypothetical protein n=1 Tax=Halovenus marina TaxID=3396621 RepID=UPI003F56AF1E
MGRAFAPVLALVLTLSLFGGLAAVDADVSPVGESDGLLIPDSCKIGEFLNIGDGCSTDQADTQDLQTKTQIYQSAASQYGINEPFLTVFNNYVKDTEDVAWLVAERAIGQSIQNGSSLTETKIAAQEAVGDYYAVKEQNFLEAWNTNAASINSLATQQSQFDEYVVDGLSSALNIQFSGDGQTAAGEQVTIDSLSTTDYTLVNGSTINLTQIDMSLTYSGVGSKSGERYDLAFEYDPINGITHIQDGSGSLNYVQGMHAGGNIIVSQPPTNSEFTEQIDTVYHPHWSEPIADLKATHSNVTADVSDYVDNAYNDINSGSVNISEWMSNVNLMNHYLTEGEGFSGAIAALAAGGMTAHDLSGTSWMEISYEAHDSALNTTYEGVLMSGEPAPNGSWEVNKTYDSEALPGSQSVATLNGDVATLNGLFTIEAVYDANGDVIEDPDLITPERTYSVANVSETNELIVDLGERIDELEEQIQENRTSGGGGIGFGGLPSPSLPSLGLGGLLGSLMSIMVIGVLLLIIAVASVASPHDPRRE